jgi:hypothetical protein
MATINIKYNPALSVFFNSDGKLVIGDVNGDYGNGNENGWGGFNPPKSSVTSANFILSNQVTGDFYIINGVGSYDLFSNGFYTTTDQLLISADVYTELANIITQVLTPYDSSQFQEGVFFLSVGIAGQYTFGLDTIAWDSDLILISNVVNTNSNCIENTLKKVSFAKNCKINKKFSTLNMYLNMGFELQNYKTNGNMSNDDDYVAKMGKVGDIFQEIKDLCNGKNNCKC